MLDIPLAYRYNTLGTVDDMILDFSKIKFIPGGRLDFQFQELLDPADYDLGDYTLPQPTFCQGQAVHQGDSFPVEGTYHSVAGLVCSRCGKPFTQPVSGTFSAVFAGSGQTDWDGERDLYELEGDLADLGPVLVDEIFFSLPMQPLCRADCQGLCPICGADLNEGRCSCRETEIDPRWDKLKDLWNQE